MVQCSISHLRAASIVENYEMCSMWTNMHVLFSRGNSVCVDGPSFPWRWSIVLHLYIAAVADSHHFSFFVV